MWFKKKKSAQVDTEGWFDRMWRKKEEAYEKARAAWTAPGSKCIGFEDCDVVEIDSRNSYLARCYEGKEELFYVAIEEGRVPMASHAYYRFYDPSEHFTLLLPRILKALEGKV